jgi:hypothetical protein
MHPVRSLPFLHRFKGSPVRQRKSAVRVERVGVHDQLWLESSPVARRSYRMNSVNVALAVVMKKGRSNERPYEFKT